MTPSLVVGARRRTQGWRVQGGFAANPPTRKATVSKAYGGFGGFGGFSLPLVYADRRGRAMGDLGKTLQTLPMLCNWLILLG